MINDPEPDDELVDGETSLDSLFDKEPDYQEWVRFIGKEYAPLVDAICYAIGRSLNPSNYNILYDWEEKVKEETYTSLLKRAESDIVSGLLIAKEGRNDYLVSIRSFYSWIKQQGEYLNKQFLKYEVSFISDTSNLSSKDGDKEERAEGKITSSTVARERAKKRHDKDKEKKKSIITLAKPIIDRGSLNHSEITNELFEHANGLSKRQVREVIKKQCILHQKTNLILGHKDYKKP